MSRRKSEWNKYRRTRETPTQAVAHLPAKEGASTGILKDSDYRRIEQETRRKLNDIRNCAAPLSVPERHYEKEFTIPKKKVGEE